MLKGKRRNKKLQRKLESEEINAIVSIQIRIGILAFKLPINIYDRRRVEQN